MTIRNELRSLYKKGEGRQQFFDMLATYSQRRSELSVEQAAANANLAYETIVMIFKELEQINAGMFVLGRRNYKTRIVWNYSPMSVGEVAQGRNTTLEAILDEYENLPAEEPETMRTEVSISDYHQIVSDAKIALARQLGLKPEQIEITVRH